MLRRKYRTWQKSYQLRKIYATLDRRPFYDIAAKYLPSDKDAIVVDIGAGNGQFAEHLDLASKYEKLFLLDGNSTTIEGLKKRFKNAVLYKAPDELPFGNATVSYIHCSHLIEHLSSRELYRFFKEIDRVLSKKGIFVVSTPMLWDKFYDDLSHVRPYNPDVLLNYLCRRPESSSADAISERYSELELVYRYRTLSLGESWGSSLAPLDFLVQLSKKVFLWLGLKEYRKNGYILVLKKN